MCTCACWADTVQTSPGLPSSNLEGSASHAHHQVADLALVLSVFIYAAETWTLLATAMKALEAFHVICQRQILWIRWSDLVDMQTPHVQVSVHWVKSWRPVASRFLHTHIPVWEFLRIRRSTGTSISFGCPPGPDWKRWTSRSMDRPDLTGLEQFTSGTLETCHPPWPCCWSDAAVPAGYAILTMMIGF